MTVVTVLYPADDSAQFDHDYYTAKHIPMVKRLWEPMGMTGVRVLRGVPGPDGKGPLFLVTTDLTFPDIASFAAAAEAYGERIFADVGNFTTIEARTQVGED